MSENEKLVERARAYVPFNHFKDGPLVAELAAALTAAEGRIKALTDAAVEAQSVLSACANVTSGPIFLRVVNAQKTLREAKYAVPSLTKDQPHEA